MTQIFKDGSALGVTPIKLSEKANLEGVEAGMPLKVTGKSKGHGFASVIKRWNFRGGPKTHGQKHYHRAPGSIGSKQMARVVPGRKMGGRYGMETITYKGIKIAEIDAENKIVMLHGSAPGIVGREVELFADLEGPSEIEVSVQTQEVGEENPEGAETEQSPAQPSEAEKTKEKKDEKVEEADQKSNV
ncbi:MAG: 50S ribosomal protein L3 [Candidatus Paceibacterota bacterium]